jgi:hypothetical protein
MRHEGVDGRGQATFGYLTSTCLHHGLEVVDRHGRDGQRVVQRQLCGFRGDPDASAKPVE